MSTRVRRVEGILSAPLDDTLLMMSIAQGMYYEAAGAGRRIWELLAEPIGEADLVERLVAEFDVAPDTCAAEAGAFLRDLMASGLAVEVTEPAP